MSGVLSMRRFWLSTRRGLMSVVFLFCVCACSKETPHAGIGAAPPGHIPPDDPRYLGSFEEIPNGKGGLIKVWSKPNAPKGKTEPANRN
jgi:hypothetical protein